MPQSWVVIMRWTEITDGTELKQHTRHLQEGVGNEAACARCAINDSYAAGKTDEFVVPTVITGEMVSHLQLSKMAIQLSALTSDLTEQERLPDAFCDDDFAGFDRGPRKKVHYVCFTDYDVTIPNKYVAFKKQEITNTFGEFLATESVKAGKNC